MHSGSLLPPVQVLAVFYKSELNGELAFSLTLELAGEYKKYMIAEAFRKRVIAMELSAEVVKDLDNLPVKIASSSSIICRQQCEAA